MKYIALLLAFALFFFVILFYHPVKEVSECSVDSDCVPAQCCHPTSCVPKEKAPDCSGVFCTLECKPGTLDCGQGYCACEAGKCVAKFK